MIKNQISPSKKGNTCCFQKAEVETQRIGVTALIPEGNLTHPDTTVELTIPSMTSTALENGNKVFRRAMKIAEDSFIVEGSLETCPDISIPTGQNSSIIWSLSNHNRC